MTSHCFQCNTASVVCPAGKYTYNIDQIFKKGHALLMFVPKSLLPNSFTYTESFSLWCCVNYRCVDREEVLPGVDSYVFVQHSNKPVITVTGNNMVTGNRQGLEDGINVFKVCTHTQGM